MLINMIAFPNCKINLGLNIVSKRSDGYHNLESIFYPVSNVYDCLEIVPSPKFEFHSYGNEIPDLEQGNSCIKAFKLIQHEKDIPNVQIHLHKNIPTGAGLGGGSSDAVATLVLLNQIFGLNYKKNKLLQLADKIGSDCPFFVWNNPVFAKSKGELLKPVVISLDDYYIKLINPKIHISTKNAFKSIIPKPTNYPIESCLKLPIEEWKEHLVNDFEEAVFEDYPQLKEIKNKLYTLGASYASMSGSGSTIYGIFEKDIDLKPHFEGMLIY
jgi:4-diphosphocytidyl-2-C-methyl-D-erythritol kinase